MQLVKMKSPANWVDRIGGIVTFGTPHLGAAIAEPGFKSGREAAVYLMMLNGTKKAASIGDVLTLIGERAVEGIEDLKAFDASTNDRENSFAAGLLDKEQALQWPNGGNRPDTLVVGGRLSVAQKTAWRRKLVAGFMTHKLGRDDHDLVVELSSSIPDLFDANFTVQVESDHFSYFDGKGRSKWAVDAAVAFVWKLLAPEIAKWCADLAAWDKARQQGSGRRLLQLKKLAQRSVPPGDNGQG